MAKVNIKGPIISNDEQWFYDWLEMEAASPKSVANQISKANGEDLEVDINSGGGSVFAGSEIYTSLKDYKGTVTVRIVGLAASAASVIAMAGDKVMMSPTAQMMIHNASARQRGDYRDMNHMSTVLKSVNQTIANAYKLKSGMSDEELLKMMDEETWLTPKQALEHKLIDEVMFEDTIQVSASIDVSNVVPREIINKLKNKIHLQKPMEEQVNEVDILMQQKSLALLNFMKLKGGINNE